MMNTTIQEFDTHVTTLLTTILPQALLAKQTLSLVDQQSPQTPQQQSPQTPQQPEIHAYGSGSAYTLQNFNGNIQQQQDALYSATQTIQTAVGQIFENQNTFLDQVDQYREEYYCHMQQTNNSMQSDQPSDTPSSAEKRRLENDILLLLQQQQKFQDTIVTQQERLTTIHNMLSAAQRENVAFNDSRLK